MIAVVDSGGANLTSVMHALERLHAQAELTADPDRIARAEKILLPGVGAAPRAMEMMRERNLVRCIREARQPVLGICLGMQLMFARSEEGEVDTLQILRGKVRRFSPASQLTVPQMGWNQIQRTSSHAGAALLRGIPDGTNFYFVHSYFAELGAYTAATCDYGEKFSAVIEQGNFLGTQFHPERSGEMGARLLQNFLEL